MKVEYKNLIYTFTVYIILAFINYKLNTHQTLYINRSSYIQDDVIGLFFISFVIYCIVYFINIILKNDAFNSDSIMSIWNQVNTNGSLFVILFLLYFKIMPFNAITFILLLIIIVIYYPLIEYTNNSTLNELYKPNLNDFSRAIDYTNNLSMNNDSSVTYYIGLNKLDSSEIIINFKGTDINDIEDSVSNATINTMDYTKEYASNTNMINELSSPVGVHSGYLKSYFLIKDSLYDKCKELLNNGANKIFISGYSLGGAMSTICAFDFHANLNKLNITANNINSIHIANPPVGNYNFVNLYNKYVINSVRLVHLNDPIPRMTDWLYVHTKNEYVVVSNKYTYSAHMLSTYDDCIISNRSIYSYVTKELLLYTIIIVVITYYIRKYYTRNIVGTRHF
jgi:hypothetical protein